MDENGNPVAYMDTKIDVQAKGSVRTALLERDGAGALVFNCVKGMWLQVALPEFDGDYHTRHQVHGLFEVSPEESRQIKGPTIQAESARRSGNRAGGLWRAVMGGYEWAAAVAAGILARLGARLILQLHLGRGDTGQEMARL